MGKKDGLCIYPLDNEWKNTLPNEIKKTINEQLKKYPSLSKYILD